MVIYDCFLSGDDIQDVSEKQVTPDWIPKRAIRQQAGATTTTANHALERVSRLHAFSRGCACRWIVAVPEIPLSVFSEVLGIFARTFLTSLARSHSSPQVTLQVADSGK